MQSELELLARQPAQLSILIIGGDALTTHLVKAVFRCSTSDVDCSAAGEKEGIELALTQPTPNSGLLVMINMDFGLLDGHRAARELRKRGFSGPIVALTTDRNRKSYVDTDFDDHVCKPIEPNALLSLADKFSP